MSIVKIISNRQLTEDYYLMEIAADNFIDSVYPGQFFNLKISGEVNYDPLLRRPISVHDINRHKKTIFLLYRIVGRGSRLLSKFTSGQSLDILGPLGQGFDLSLQNKNILIIGGGMGLAPLFYLSKTIKKTNQLTIMLGAGRAEELDYFIKKFSTLYNLNKFAVDSKQDFTADRSLISSKIILSVATTDGSRGFKGNVVDLCLEKGLNKYDYLYSCGPEKMLRKIQQIAIDNKIAGQFSVEERMGCGTGLCLSCVCHTKTGNQRVCKDGPVFNIAELVFPENQNNNKIGDIDG